MKVDNNENELLSKWIEDYYRELVRSSSIGGVNIKYYKSLRGYFRHSTLLTDIKLKEFGIIDYKVWEQVLTMTKSSHNASESGGVFFRYNKFEHICKRRAFYNTKKKFLELELLIETPFKDFYVLNPMYIIKMYSPE